MGLDELRERMAEFLRSGGLEAVTAWTETARPAGPAAVVSLRRWESGPAGFRDYLGERWNGGTNRWEELYGRRVRLVFGLDLYAPRGGAEGLEKAFDALAERLRDRGPEGLRVLELSAGETAYREELERFYRPVEAVCEACLYAVAGEDGIFSDFEIRGEKI